jgi:hypothetical protein
MMRRYYKKGGKICPSGKAWAKRTFGKCGTSKDKKNPDRCLPRSKASSLSQSQRATTAKKKKREGAKGKTVVKNTKPATVKLRTGGLARRRRHG